MWRDNCQAVPRGTTLSCLSSPGVGRLALAVAAATTILAWAGAFVAIGVAAQELSPAPFALARLGSAALILLLVAPVLPGLNLQVPRLAHLPAIAVMALLGFSIYHTALNAGQRIVTPGVASLLIATLPIFASVFARVTLSERLPAVGWAGIAVGFIGVGLLVTGGASLSIDPNAVLILLAAASGAAFMVMQRFLTRTYSAFTLTVWGLSFGALMLTPFLPRLVAEVSVASDATVMAVIYLGTLPTALGYVTWAFVLKALPAAQATALLFFIPPIAFTLAWLILGAVPTWLDLVGGLVIIAGVAIVQYARVRKGSRRAPTGAQAKLG